MSLNPRFVERMTAILDTEADAFFACCETPMPRTFRWEGKGNPPQSWPCVPVNEIPNVYRMTERFPLGKQLQHFTGLAYSQSLASMLPSLALGVEEGDKVLDMCAAPGSKTTQLSRMVGSDGVIIANEISASRSKKLAANINRMGAWNVIIAQHDGVRMPMRYGQEFDKILLDAPCSSEGFARRNDQYLKKDWKERYIFECADLQRKLILSAFKMLRPEGEMIYSTCTSAPEENEAVVQYLLDTFGEEYVEILPVELEKIPKGKSMKSWNEQYFSSKIVENSWRMYPHITSETWDTEVFFLCKIKKKKGLKLEMPEKKPPSSAFVTLRKNSLAEATVKLAKQFGMPRDWLKGYTLIKKNEAFWVTSNRAAIVASRNQHRRVGVPIIDKYGIPTDAFALRFGSLAQKNIYALNAEENRKWMAGEDIRLNTKLDQKDGTVLLVKYSDFCVGVTKVLKQGKVLKNRLARELTMNI